MGLALPAARFGVYLSVKELELKKVRFDVAFPPGEIDFSDSGLSQQTMVEAIGSAELLANTLGEIRITMDMEDHARAPCGLKRDSSMRVASRLVRDGAAQGFVSAGNTGA
jgi:hypothetical protein